jgi:hypothetical protein
MMKMEMERAIPTELFTTCMLSAWIPGAEKLIIRVSMFTFMVGFYFPHPNPGRTGTGKDNLREQSEPRGDPHIDRAGGPAPMEHYFVMPIIKPVNAILAFIIKITCHH